MRLTLCQLIFYSFLDQKLTKSSESQRPTPTGLTVVLTICSCGVVILFSRFLSLLGHTSSTFGFDLLVSFLACHNLSSYNWRRLWEESFLQDRHLKT
jgi:hypothetical protein